MWLRSTSQAVTAHSQWTPGSHGARPFIGTFALVVLHRYYGLRGVAPRGGVMRLWNVMGHELRSWSFLPICHFSLWTRDERDEVIETCDKSRRLRLCMMDSGNLCVQDIHDAINSCTEVIWWLHEKLLQGPFRPACHECVRCISKCKKKNYAVIFLHRITVQLVAAITKLCIISLYVGYESAEAPGHNLQCNKCSAY